MLGEFTIRTYHGTPSFKRRNSAHSERTGKFSFFFFFYPGDNVDREWNSAYSGTYQSEIGHTYYSREWSCAYSLTTQSYQNKQKSWRNKKKYMSKHSRRTAPIQYSTNESSKTQNFTPFFFLFDLTEYWFQPELVVSGEDFDVCLCSVRPVRPNAGVATVYRPAWLSTAGTPFNRCFSGSSRHRAVRTDSRMFLYSATLFLIRFISVLKLQHVL